jgi:pyrroloquinoline quinone biosynthesis protein D
MVYGGVQIMSSQQQIDMQDSYIINPIFIFRWEQSQNAKVLLYPEGVVKLNETGSIILEHCTGDKTVEQLINIIAEKYDGTAREQVAKGVINFLEVSNGKGWIKRNN